MIVIQEINSQNLPDAGRCDGVFTVDARLVPSAENGVIHYTFVEVSPPYQKRYPPDKVNYAEDIDNPDKTIFFAYIDGQVAGQIRLSRHWNRYAYVEDIVVDVHFRKQGVGYAMIERTKQWARDKSLAGIMLETQSNNMGGCHLYQKCGFELGGFDRFLYRAVMPGTDEIALYWYWVPENGEKHVS